MYPWKSQRYITLSPYPKKTDFVQIVFILKKRIACLANQSSFYIFTNMLSVRLSLKQFDSLAGLASKNQIALWLERLAFGSLILMALSAPHSIAATQVSWLLGMIFWVSRYFVMPRPKFVRTSLFAPFVAFFGWTVLSSIFSYAPDIFDRQASKCFTLSYFLFSRSIICVPSKVLNCWYLL